ncbi:MAG: hypothetical protein J6K32_02410 [Clostridia bacterium]|nr:hypothetical protein [Clostridia bacterium]
MDTKHYPQGEFALAEDERFMKGAWLRIISEPERQSVLRGVGAPARSQFSHEEMQVMALLCGWQALTRGMLAVLLRMRRCAVMDEELDAILAKLVRMRLCGSFRLMAKDGGVSAPVYCMLGTGTNAYRQMTEANYYALDLLESPAKIEAGLLAARVAIAFLNEGVVPGGVAMRRCYMEHKGRHPDAIVRPTALFCLEDRNVFVEAVRRGDGWEEDFVSKAGRYGLVAGYEAEYPVVIFCGEDAAHCDRMAQLIEQSRAKICPLFLDAPDADGSGLTGRLYCLDGGVRRRVRFGRPKAA